LNAGNVDRAENAQTMRQRLLHPFYPHLHRNRG
jgi:hypothetical protein